MSARPCEHGRYTCLECAVRDEERRRANGPGTTATGGTPERAGEGSDGTSTHTHIHADPDEGAGTGLSLAREPAPDVLGPIEGYRLWGVGAGKLFPITGRPPWSLGANQASCGSEASHYGGHSHGPVPGSRCGCGFWAYLDREVMFSRLDRDQLTALRDGHMAMGRVRLWGRVRPFEHGWRAQYARVTALYQIPGAARPWLGPDTDGLWEPVPVDELGGLLEVALSMDPDIARAGAILKNVSVQGAGVVVGPTGVQITANMPGPTPARTWPWVATYLAIALLNAGIALAAFFAGEELRGWIWTGLAAAWAVMAGIRWRTGRP